MKYNLTLSHFCTRMTAQLKNYFKTDIPRYHIFNSIPHRRVISQNAPCKEIFDLYQLGIFSASNAMPSINKHQEDLENLELVELQPQTEYRPHYHKNSSATIYIILGSGQFILDEKFIEYEACKRIVIPAGAMHGFQTQTRTLFLSIQTPPIIDPHSDHIDIYYDKEKNYAKN